MENQASSRKRFRILFWVWAAIGVALIGMAFSPQFKKIEQRQATVQSLTKAREALAGARKAAATSTTPEAAQAQKALLAKASQCTKESLDALRTSGSEAAVEAEILSAMIELESGRAFEALDALFLLADNDKKQRGGKWTENTAMIQAAIAEARFKIALMCRDEGDGYENWSKFAEEAAHCYRELADQASSEKDRDIYLKNLAACTRLIHGGDDSNHSLGFPVCKTVDCAKVARIWKRPPPSGGGGGNGEPWQNPPPEPNENTEGR